MPTVAVIGCGDVASVHFAAIMANDDAELVGVCDVDAAAAAAAGAEYGVPAFGDHLSLIDALRPDVVHICTPHHQHVEIAVDALERGVHVVLEKPLASEVVDGQRIVDAAAASSAKIGICFQNRYNPTSVKLREVLEAGTYGPVVGARAQVMWTRTVDYYQAKPWRGTWAGGGGGLMMNQAVHTVDLVQWLLGDVVDVRGSIGTLKFPGQIEVEDTAAAFLLHESGVATSFYATLTHHESAPVLIEVACRDAVLRLEGDLVVRWPDGRREVLAPADVVRTARSYWGASHERFINDFYARLAEPEAFWIDAAEAFKTLDIVKRWYASAGA